MHYFFDCAVSFDGNQPISEELLDCQPRVQQTEVTWMRKIYRSNRLEVLFHLLYKYEFLVDYLRRKVCYVLNYGRRLRAAGQ